MPVPQFIRSEYGSPRFLVAPGVESPYRLDLAKVPPVPTSPGYYVLSGADWVKTDGLTYRTWGQTLRVL